MATEPPTSLHKFFVYAPDVPESSALRQQILPEHLRTAIPLSERGILQLGGVLLSPSSILPGGTEESIGSGMIMQASSIEELQKLLREDAFYKQNVWDREKMVILPIKMAVGPL